MKNVIAMLGDVSHVRGTDRVLWKQTSPFGLLRSPDSLTLADCYLAC